MIQVLDAHCEITRNGQFNSRLEKLIGSNEEFVLSYKLRPTHY